MLVEQRRGQRLDHLEQPLGGDRRGGLHRFLRLALCEGDGLAGQRHRRQRFADGVEQPEQQRLAGDRAIDEPGGLHRRREHLARGAGQQRAIEVEEGARADPDGLAVARPVGCGVVIGATVRQNGRNPAWGKRGLSTRTL